MIVEVWVRYSCDCGMLILELPQDVVLRRTLSRQCRRCKKIHHIHADKQQPRPDDTASESSAQTGS